jgi:signal transduction histidine kinase
VEDLRSLPSRPEVRHFPSLFGSAGELQPFAPHAAFCLLGSEPLEEAGALRLLRSLVPGLTLVLVAPVERELQVQPLCLRLGAGLLLMPYGPGDVAAVLEQALAGSDRPREEVFLDLARGIADEINNPLMYVSGYLQLLAAGVDPQREKDRYDQLTFALSGVKRIQAAVERVRLLARASGGLRQQGAVDVLALLHKGVGEMADAGRMVPWVSEPEQAAFGVRGETELLEPAVAAMCRVAGELQELGCNVHLLLSKLDTAVRLRLQVSGPGTLSWRLPRTFEPYYLSRILRGTSQGFGLFLAQLVTLAHRGQATARRLPDGSLALDLWLPA